MILVKETTKWNMDFQPNHVYLLSDDKHQMIGHMSRGDKKLTIMSKPMRFDPRYRTFKVIKKNLSFVKD